MGSILRLEPMPKALKSPRKKILPLRHMDDYSEVVLVYSGSAESLPLYYYQITLIY